MLRLSFLLLLIIIAIPTKVASAPLRILSIGDSLTEEYAFELPFSAPESNPSNANTRNWPELIRIFRSADVSLGPYESTAFSYGDLRNAGHEWNFGIPGMTVTNWYNLLATDDFFDPPDDDLGFAYYDTRRKLIDELAVAQVVVIFLGANDLKQDYDDVFNDTEASNFYTRIVNRTNAIHNWVRLRTNVPIVVCTIPDIGVTPAISTTYSDPVKQAAARAKIATLNQDLMAKMAANPSPPTIARIDRLTDRLFDESPFHLNGTIFIRDGTPENPPDRMFCRDDFHVSTIAQALIANELIASINSATGRTIPVFSKQQILNEVLGLDPDQPFIDWVTTQGVAEAEMDDDPDHDGYPNLVEYLLGTSPGMASSPLTGNFSPGDSLSWTLDEVAVRYAGLIAEESSDLDEWSVIPAERMDEVNGAVSITPGEGDERFVRLRAVKK